MKVHSSRLTLGAVVRLWTNEPFGDAIVKKIDPNGDINLFRPYGVTADFSYTGGVICYVGIEEFTAQAGLEFELVREGPTLR